MPRRAAQNSSRTLHAASATPASPVLDRTVLAFVHYAWEILIQPCRRFIFFQELPPLDNVVEGRQRDFAVKQCMVLSLVELFLLIEV